MYLILITAVAVLFYIFDGHKIITQMAIEKWRKFRQVNELVGTKYSSFSTIVWISLCLIAKMYWLNFLQWINGSIVYFLDKRTVLVSYVLKGKLYTIVIHVASGPSKVLMVLDESYTDISDQILPFLGPEQNWHSVEFRPSFWQKRKLIFEMYDGERKEFTQDQIIDLN
jgi:archaellum component FlaF (FlaF/FlaG flagellin family)